LQIDATSLVYKKIVFVVVVYLKKFVSHFVCVCVWVKITFKTRNWSGHHLVEDVVWTLQGLLGDDTSLLQKVGLNISTGQFTRSREMDTDEFTLECLGFI
jgi:hypothetical protein